MPLSAGVAGAIAPPHCVADRSRAAGLPQVGSALPPAEAACWNNCKATPPQESAQLKQIHARIASLAVQIDKAAGLALQLEDPAPAIRKIDALERERKDLVRQHAEMQADREMADAVGRISLKQMVEILGGLAETIETAPADRLKAALRGFVDRIVLDPVSLECRVDYRVSATNRVPMVLLPGFEPGFKP